VPAVQFLGTRGFFRSYDASAEQPLTPATASSWAKTFGKLARKVSYDATAEARSLAEKPDDATPFTLDDFIAQLQENLAGSPLEPQAVNLAVGQLGLKPSAGLSRGDACRLMYALLAQLADPQPAPGT
jgi:hypothetical protein